MTFRRKAKADKNQPDIVAKFRRLGYSVHHTHQLKNFVDIIISKDFNGLERTAVVEIKDGSLPPSARKLTEGEKAFKESWQGLYFICQSLDDIDIIDQEIKKRSAL